MNQQFADSVPRTAPPRVLSDSQSIGPFRVHFPDEALADMTRCISAMRWPDNKLVVDQSQGVQLATIQELARYWA